MWMTPLDAVVPVDGLPRSARCASGSAASPSSRLLVSIASMIATATSSRPMTAVPMTSK